MWLWSQISMSHKFLPHRQTHRIHFIAFIGGKRQMSWIENSGRQHTYMHSHTSARIFSPIFSHAMLNLVFCASFAAVVCYSSFVHLPCVHFIYLFIFYSVRFYCVAHRVSQAWNMHSAHLCIADRNLCEKWIARNVEWVHNYAHTLISDMSCVSSMH